LRPPPRRSAAHLAGLARPEAGTTTPVPACANEVCRLRGVHGSYFSALSVRTVLPHMRASPVRLGTRVSPPRLTPAVIAAAVRLDPRTGRRCRKHRHGQHPDSRFTQKSHKAGTGGNRRGPEPCGEALRVTRTAERRRPVSTAVCRQQAFATPREARAACRFPWFGRDGKRRPCRSPRCPDPLCRRKHAEKESAVLVRSFRDRPPDYCFTLKVEDGECIPDVLMAAYLKCFTQRFRDFRKSSGAEMEYDIRLEFDERGRPHGHLTVITSLGWTAWKMKQLVRVWWAASCQDRPVKVYGDVVYSTPAHARYVTKNLKDRSGVFPPPDDWNGRSCRLNWRSRGFLSKRKATLWREQIAEWYRPEPESAAPRDADAHDPTATQPTTAVAGRPADSSRDARPRLCGIFRRESREFAQQPVRAHPDRRPTQPSSPRHRWAVRGWQADVVGGPGLHALARDATPRRPRGPPFRGQRGPVGVPQSDQAPGTASATAGVTTRRTMSVHGLGVAPGNRALQPGPPLQRRRPGQVGRLASRPPSRLGPGTRSLPVEQVPPGELRVRWENGEKSSPAPRDE
jgi:hypothetical protein